MAKIHCDLTFENEKVTYAKIIENQAKELVKSLLNNTEYSGFLFKTGKKFQENLLIFVILSYFPINTFQKRIKMCLNSIKKKIKIKYVCFKMM